MRDRKYALAAWITGGILLGSMTLAAPTSVSDRDFGLSKSSVFEVPSPPEVTQNRTDPGEVPPVPPPFGEAPPIIPHGISDFVPVTLGENMCLECHLVEEKVEGRGSTKGKKPAARKKAAPRKKATGRKTAKRRTTSRQSATTAS